MNIMFCFSSFFLFSAFLGLLVNGANRHLIIYFFLSGQCMSLHGNGMEMTLSFSVKAVFVSYAWLLYYKLFWNSLLHDAWIPCYFLYDNIVFLRKRPDFSLLLFWDGSHYKGLCCIGSVKHFATFGTHCMVVLFFACQGELDFVIWYFFDKQFWHDFTYERQYMTLAHKATLFYVGEDYNYYCCAAAFCFICFFSVFYLDICLFCNAALALSLSLSVCLPLSLSLSLSPSLSVFLSLSISLCLSLTRSRWLSLYCHICLPRDCLSGCVWVCASESALVCVLVRAGGRRGGFIMDS